MTASAEEMVRVERDGATTWLVLDAPDRLNSFTRSGYRELTAAVDAASSDSDVRVVVITGTGRAFTAGADRSLFDGTATREERVGTEVDFRAMIEAIAACPKPVLAAVNGLAVGIGATMLLHCDLVVLAETARLRLPFTKLGIVPEAASTVLLPARGSWQDATWALLSSDWIDPPTAVAMGLAWRIVPHDDLRTEVGQAATTLAEQDSAAVAATKRLMADGRAELVSAAMDREQAAMGELLRGRRRR